MTEAQYSQNLALLERESPKEPLLPILRKGFSQGNVLFMGVAMQRCEPFSQQSSENDTQEDTTLRKLTRLIAAAYGDLRKARNKFHDCQKQEHYAKVSDEVQRIWNRQILPAIARRDYYAQHGEEMPESEEADEIPEDGIALQKYINSLRARISQTKKRIEESVNLDAAKKKEVVETCEARLRKLKNQLAIAEARAKTIE